MIVLPGANAPPTDGVNENVTVATVLSTMRPMPEMTKTPIETSPPTIPEEMASEGSESALVSTNMPSLDPFGDEPIARP